MLVGTGAPALEHEGNTALSNHERVGKTLEMLNAGLKPLVERDLEYGLRQPWTSIGLDDNEMSLDGPLFEPHAHPRAFGSMPRFLGHYVRNGHLLTLEQAVPKITSLPAERERLYERCLLRPGFYAESRSSTRPAFTTPPPTGIRHHSPRVSSTCSSTASSSSNTAA